MGEAVWKEQGNRGGEATDQLSLDLPVGGWEGGRRGGWEQLSQGLSTDECKASMSVQTLAPPPCTDPSAAFVLIAFRQ